MNKRNLKKYIESNIKSDLKKAYKYGEKYIITNSYSLIILNNNYDLEIAEDTLNLSKHIEDYENNYETYYTFMTITNPDEICEPITNDYGFSTKLFKSVKNVINANIFAILERKKDIANAGYIQYIVRLENTKTKEKAYIMPMRRF